MNKLIISTAMTVDGVMDVAEWFVAEGDHNDPSRELLERSAALLMGRKTYEGLAAYWPTAEGEWADLLNPMPKYVVSRTLSGPLDWNATALDGELEQAVTKLKSELDGDLFQTGSGELARNLLAANLVDELWFWMHPSVWGEGARPFDGARFPVRLLESRAYDTGVIHLRYTPA
jgi:dihydrofolate reductase